MNDSSELLSRFLSRVEGVKRSGGGFTFRCPAHEDKEASAFVKADNNGNLIVKDFAGCSRKAICEAIGITESDLYAKRGSNGSSRELIANYNTLMKQEICFTNTCATWKRTTRKPSS